MMFIFFNDTATTEIYTLSLHDALPICSGNRSLPSQRPACSASLPVAEAQVAATRPTTATRSTRKIWATPDRKSTRLNSSHANISYAVFCLKKKNNTLHPISAQLYSLYS